MKYYDKNNREIREGMFLRFEDGSIERVYESKGGLGINASNEEYLRAHGLCEYDREIYLLSNFSPSKISICGPDEVEEQEQLAGMTMQQ